MWTRLNRPLSSEVVDAILKDASELEGVVEHRHFVRAGKKFFKKKPGYNYLRSIIRHIDREISLNQQWIEPAIHHTFLLYKSPGGPATNLHQDRPYWTTIENDISMMTFWIALEEIDSKMGCLKLNPFDFVSPLNFKQLNTPAEVYPHVKEEGESNQHVAESLVSRLEENIAPVPVKKGDVIIFDAFQLHASEKNSTQKTRRAMKIVIGERDSMSGYLIALNALDPGRKVRSIFMYPLCRFFNIK